MEPATSGSTSFWKTVPGILTAVGGFLTAVAALIGALAAAGVIGPNASPSPVSPSSPPATGSTAAPSSPTDSPEPPEPEPELASIDLVYTGDQYGCTLHLTVQVDGQTVLPSGNRFTIRNLPKGVQDYSIRGTISCLTVGSCTATGSGAIEVVVGHTYYVSWLNTTAGGCDVALNQ